MRKQKTETKKYILWGVLCAVAFALYQYGSTLWRMIKEKLNFKDAAHEQANQTPEDSERLIIEGVVDFVTGEIEKTGWLQDQDEVAMVRELSRLNNKSRCETASILYKKNVGKSFRADIITALADTYNYGNYGGRWIDLPQVVQTNLK